MLDKNQLDKIFGGEYDIKKEIEKRIVNSVLFSKIFLFIVAKHQSKKNAFKLKEVMKAIKHSNRSSTYQLIEPFIIHDILKSIRKKGERESTYVIVDFDFFGDEELINKALENIQ